MLTKIKRIIYARLIIDRTSVLYGHSLLIDIGWLQQLNRMYVQSTGSVIMSDLLKRLPF